MVLEVENGLKFPDQLSEAQAQHLCMLDFNMPIKNGFETIVHLKKNWPNLIVAFLSMHEEDRYYERSMDLGADGFVKKDAPMEELKNTALKLTNKQMAFAA